MQFSFLYNVTIQQEMSKIMISDDFGNKIKTLLIK